MDLKYDTTSLMVLNYLKKENSLDIARYEIYNQITDKL